MAGNTTAPGIPLDRAAWESLEWFSVVCMVFFCLASLAFVILLLCAPKEWWQDHAGGGDDSVPRQQQQQPAAAVAIEIELMDAAPTSAVCKAGLGGCRGEATCGVCQAELAGGGALRALPPCMHCFHSACAREWVRLHATCPLCKAPVATV